MENAAEAQELSDWQAMRIRRLARSVRAHANAIIDLQTAWPSWRAPAWVGHAISDHLAIASDRAKELVELDPRYHG